MEVRQLEAIPLVQRRQQGVLLAQFSGHLVDDVDVLRGAFQQARQDERDRAADVQFGGLSGVRPQFAEVLSHLLGIGLLHERGLDVWETDAIQRLAADRLDGRTRGGMVKPRLPTLLAPTTFQGAGVSRMRRRVR